MRSTSRSGRVNSQPPRISSRSSGAMGRSGSRPRMWKRASMPSAAATGSRKRSVLPLSPQSASQEAAGVRMGSTRRPVPVASMLAPKAVRQRTVAEMSSEPSPMRMSVGPSASAAQISARCASDFEGMAANVPRSARGEMRAITA